EAHVLVDALAHDVEEAAAKVRVTLGDRFRERASHLHRSVERAAGAPQPRDQPREEREVELARVDVARETAIEDGRHSAREQGAAAEVRVELHVSEESPSARWIDADVQQGAAGVPLEVEV